MAMEAQFYRKQGHYVVWDKGCAAYNCIGNCNKCNFRDTKFDKIITEPENLPFLTLPRPDRVFTRAKDYTSGNYKFLPGTHIMSASGCWWGKCSFCVENGKPYEVRPVEDVIREIEECRALDFKEIFDDSATFPDSLWLRRFCAEKIGWFPEIVMGCNMRIGADVDFDLIKYANFRMLLYGIESANQATLDKIQKGVKVEDIIPTIKKASEAGLEPHICVIFGHPNETDNDAINTLKLVHHLLQKGFAKTAQASFYQVAGEIGQESHRKYIPQIYNAAYHLDFWFNQLRDVHTIDDLKYLWLKIKKGLQR